jgi:hypothetical protein
MPDSFFEQSVVNIDGQPTVRVRFLLHSSQQSLQPKHLQGELAYDRLVRFLVAFLDGQDVGTWPDGGPGLSEEAKKLLQIKADVDWKERVRWSEESGFFSLLHTVDLPKRAWSRSTFARGSSTRANLRRFAKAWIEEIYGSSS